MPRCHLMAYHVGQRLSLLHRDCVGEPQIFPFFEPLPL